MDPIAVDPDNHTISAEAYAEYYAQQREYRLRLAHIPPALAGCLETWRMGYGDGHDADRRTALRLAESYIANPETANLVLSGVAGTGKSKLAACIMSELVGGGGTGSWVAWRSTVVAIRATYHESGGRSLNDILDEIGADTAQYMVVDDCGPIVPGDRIARDESLFLSDLFDKRENEGLGTITTTNSTERALREWAGDAVVSRMTRGAVIWRGWDRMSDLRRYKSTEKETRP